MIKTQLLGFPVKRSERVLINFVSSISKHATNNDLAYRLIYYEREQEETLAGVCVNELTLPNISAKNEDLGRKMINEAIENQNTDN